MTASREMTAGLRRAYLRVLTPAAALAPLPLIWTGGTSVAAIASYEVILLWLAWRGRGGRPVRLSNAMLNVLGLLYLAWLGFETVTLRVGLLRSVSHLLLFTALAKLASLKRPNEARMALLVLFLLILAAASSSTHVTSLLYFAAMAWLSFRTLARLAVLADFDDAPPDRVLDSVPTHGLTIAAIAGGALCSAPLFFLLPRLHGPFAVAPFRVDDAFSQAMASDRVDLDAFSAAKRSDRVILRLSSSPPLPVQDELRLREAVFTEYNDGVWVRDPRVGPRRGEKSAFTLGGPAPERPLSVVTVDQNVYGQGFLFLPYGVYAVRVERGRASEMQDGVMQVGSGRRSIRYQADVRRTPARGAGRGVIPVSDVPEEVRDYAYTLTGDLANPIEIYRRIEEHFRKDFIYTLEPPKARSGDPIVHFLKRSKAGHCEYFASAAAMMLTTRGVRARLVTGSYGGEAGLLSNTIVVRAPNLHAWVEADLDGTGFSVLDPTPPAGIPPALTRFSILSRLASLGREIEFLYDRRVLGFDSGDQVGVVETVREGLGSAAGRLAGLGKTVRDSVSTWTAALLLGGALLVWLLARGRFGGRRTASPATRAYLALRRMLSRRRGALTPSVPPAEVARLFAEEVPAGGEDAAAVVEIYCASAFGGIQPAPEDVRELSARLKRLKKLA